MTLGFIKTGEDLEVKNITNTKPTAGEGMSPLPLSLPSEAHPHEYLHRESDTAERSFRPHASLSRVAIQEKFVSCSLHGYWLHLQLKHLIIGSYSKNP